MPQESQNQPSQSYNDRVLCAGSIADIANFLDCSRTTVWRRTKDHPEAFIRLGKTQLILLKPTE